MSTFTDWNGPQISNLKSSDLIKFADAYTAIKTTLDTHIAQKVSDSVDVHGLKQYIDDQIDTVEASIPKLTGYLTKAAADDAYLTKAKADTYYKAASYSPDLSSYATTTALSAYLKKTDLATDTVITAIKSDITAIKNWVNSNGVFEKPILKASQYVEGIIKAIEQVQISFKKFNAAAGGSNDTGVYYILGMLDDRAGTAYVRFTDTTSFAAVVNFAVTSECDADGNVTEFKDGQLSVTTDIDKADFTGVHFLIVKGTSDGAAHTYLAIQTAQWLSKASSTSGYGLFSAIPFEACGVNFVPVGSTGYVAPTGATSVLVDKDYYAIEDRVTSVENKLSAITGINDKKTIVAWPEYDANGVAINVPEGFHACDGTAVEDETVRSIIGNNYPLIDYHIIQIKKTVDYD